MTRHRILLATWACALGFTGCSAEGDDPIDAENGAFGSGKADGALDPDSPEAQAVLALVNDPAVDLDELDHEVKLNAKAAIGIIEHRDGADGEPGTADDDLYGDLAELDRVPFVGQVALDLLVAYAIEHGYLAGDTGTASDVIFSPQLLADSHNARVAELIGGAQTSIDIAMYSFSDAAINTALDAAVDRGVKVRFLFETANADRKLTGPALASSKSGRLEAMGVDVRWVNKIMHHKFMIVDGPRDVAGTADTAMLVSGSGNWSNGAATRYDENTLFLEGHRELNLRMQREFNHLWDHSRDLVSNPAIVTEHSSLVITDELIGDEPGEHAYFTSANFKITGTNADTFTINGGNEIADQLVAAIEGASESIHIASGHLRSRPVAEALMAKKAADPDMDIKVYLDGQEYISEATHDIQVEELEDCLAAAGGSATKIRDCNDSGFLFGLAVGTAGIDVRYKYYSYRWSASNAIQMHHKYMIVDGDELWTGSYNLSDNAEHNTFENMLHFSGPDAAAIVDRYESNFASMWVAGDGLLATLRQTISSVATASVPLVFTPMALEWQEVTDLKDLLRDECPLVNSPDFRSHPEAHPFCS